MDFNIFDGHGHMPDAWFMHSHDCLELNYAVRGGGTYYIGDMEYEIETGDLFIINNCEYHAAINCSGNLTLKVIVFNPEIVWSGSSGLDQQYLKTFFGWKDSFKHHIRKTEPITEKVAKLFYEIEEEWQVKRVGCQLVIKALLLQILAILYRAFEATEPYSRQVLKFQNDYNRIAGIISYIDRHFHDDLTLEQLADMAHMNPNYFSSYFKRVITLPLFAYIRKKRLDNACLLLRTTRMSITDIATAAGFSNISYFNKAFKEAFKLSPSQYRE